MKNLQCAIVGLGKVGLLFDEEPGRDGIWTHFSALERLSSEGFNLVAVCDPDPAKIAKARQRNPNLRFYATIEQLLEKEQLDIITLSSPTQFHGEQIVKSAGKVMGIFCEKPLADSFPLAQQALDLCKQHKTKIVVNYYKRFDANFPLLREQVNSGRIGTVTFSSAIFTGPLDAVGSHALDLLLYYNGPIDLKYVVKKKETMIAIFQSQNGSIVELKQLGPREKFIFEIELLGTEGRIRILDNGSNYELELFRPSLRYAGYFELSPQINETQKPLDRFLPLYRALGSSIRKNEMSPNADGRDALQTQKLLQEIEDFEHA